MVGKDPSARALVPLSEPVLQILISLSNKELHGYAILGDIEARTGQEPRISTSTLYGAIQRMLRDGLIEESEERPDPALDDHRRRYYRITGFGREVLHLEAQRIRRLAQSVEHLEFGA